MSIESQGEIWRNLPDQVEFLTRKVQEHYARDRVLADFGIRIVGEPVSYTSQIPGYPGYTPGLQFGDAYLVSINADGREPYDTYAWTRTRPDAAPEEGAWVDIGSLAIPGPQGIQGEQGPQGIPGPASKWYAGGATLPSGDFTEGDMAILADGSVYRYAGQDWQYVTNVRGPQGVRGPTGPQGPQGIQGDQGPAGPVGPPASAIRIIGSLASVDYLPDPSTLSQADGVPAYLIVVGSETRLYYIQGAVGEESWGYIPFTGQGTIVTTGGTALSTWDTNTKLDKKNPGKAVVYGTNNANQQVEWNLDSAPIGKTVALRTSVGNVQVATPVNQNEATPKKYVDDLVNTKVSKTSLGNCVYATNTEGVDSTVEFSSAVKQYTLMYRYTNGRCKVGTPVADDDASTKKYVDDAFIDAKTDHSTQVVTIVGPVAAVARLDLSDLADIVPGTPVHIFASIDTAGIQGLPSAFLSIGNVNVANDNTSTYLGIPFFDNIATCATLTLFQDGTNFITMRAPRAGEYGSATLKGTYVTLGIQDNYGGQTTLTVTYTRHT